MHSLEVHSNESTCRKSGRLGLEQVMSIMPFFTWSVTQKNRISIDREHCFLIMSFSISVAVMLKQCMVVAGCGCPISCKFSHIILPSLLLEIMLSIQLLLPMPLQTWGFRTWYRLWHWVKLAWMDLTCCQGKNVLPHDFLHLFLKGRRHQNGYSIPCQMHGSVS